MEHSFNVDVAIKYGIEEAILLNHIYFWIEKNKANDKHFHDGKYWTYNTKKAFSKLFPYMTPRKIDYALNNLIEKGLIITAYYNEKPTDRTLWYSLTKMGYCILQNCEMENTKLENDNNIYIDTKPDIKQTNIEDKESIIKEVFDFWNSKNISNHIKLNEDRKKAISKRLKDYSVDEIKLAISHYEIVLHDKNSFWNYTWSLEDFLNRKNGFTTFLDDGSNWVSYNSGNKKSNNPYKSNQEISRETAYPEYDNLNYY